MALIKSVRGFTPKWVRIEKTILEAHSLYAGIPAKRIKTIDPHRLESMIGRIAKDYVTYAGW